MVKIAGLLRSLIYSFIFEEIFNAFDVNNDGIVTEEEFINGCLSDHTFIKVMDDMSLDFIWGQ